MSDIFSFSYFNNETGYTYPFISGLVWKKGNTNKKRMRALTQTHNVTNREDTTRLIWFATEASVPPQTQTRTRKRAHEISFFCSVCYKCITSCVCVDRTICGLTGRGFFFLAASDRRSKEQYFFCCCIFCFVDWLASTINIKIVFLYMNYIYWKREREIRWRQNRKSTN